MTDGSASEVVTVGGIEPSNQDGASMWVNVVKGPSFYKIDRYLSYKIRNDEWFVGAQFLQCEILEAKQNSYTGQWKHVHILGEEIVSSILH